MKNVSSSEPAFTFNLIMLCLLIGIFLVIHSSSAADPDQLSTDNPLSDQEIEQIFERGWWLLSQIHRDKSGLDEVILLYQKVLTAYPRHKDIYWKLAEITFKKAETVSAPENSIKLYEKSLDYARKAVDLNPECFEPHFWVGCSSARLAELYSVFRAARIIDEAIDELQLAISIDGDHRLATTANAILAAIYIQMPWPMRNLDKAEHFATTAVTKDPNLTLASLQLATVHAKRKEYHKALQEISRCLSLRQPTYVWDAELYDWPAARKLKMKIKSEIE